MAKCIVYLVTSPGSLGYLISKQSVPLNKKLFWAAAHILYTLQGQEVQSLLEFLYYPYWLLSVFIIETIYLSTFTPLKKKKKSYCDTT